MSADPAAITVPTDSGARPEACTTPARRLLYDLVSRPSPSGEEAPAIACLSRFFEANGRSATVDDAGNLRAPADDAVLLTSHVDTVPGAPEPSVTEANGVPVLAGRGAVDAKGPLAAMAVAAVAAGVSFAAVVGEETGSTGARHLVRDRPPPMALINGEPTGTDGIALAYRGLVRGRYQALTPAVHGSRPEATAIDHAVAFWHGVRSLPEARDETGVDAVTATPLAVDGGRTDDGLAVEATLEFEVRVPTATTPAAVRSAVASLVETGDLEWTGAVPPVRVDSRSSLAAAFRRAIRHVGREPRHLTKSGTCDMNVYATGWDCPMVTYGPGDASLSHTPAERIGLPEVDAAVDVLVRATTDASHRVGDERGGSP
ncbi:MAG: [LysW]-lysine hydrolase [Halobacteriota archaeon]